MSDTKINVLITASNQAQNTIDSLVKGVQDLQAAFANVNVEAGKADASVPLEKTATAATHTSAAVEATATAHKHAGAAAHEHSGIMTLLGEAFEVVNHRVSSLAFGLQAAAETFAAYEAVKLTKEVTELADRVAVLNTALSVLARNVGIEPEGIFETAEAIEKLGFDASNARENLAKLTQVGIDPGTFGVALAKAAQDLSIIAGQTSGQTFTTLVQAVETGRTLMLRRLGIVVDEVKVVTDAEAKYGVTLDDAAKKQVVLAAVLEAASKVSGLYAENVNSLQVQQNLLSIALEESGEALGRQFRPGVVAVVEVLRQLLTSYTSLKAGSTALTESQKEFGLTADQIAQSESTVAAVIHSVGDAIVGTIKFLQEHRDLLKVIFELYISYKAVPLIITAIEFAFVNLTKVILFSRDALVLVKEALLAIEVQGGVLALAANFGKVGSAVGPVVPLMTQIARSGVGVAFIAFGNAALGFAGALRGVAVAAAPVLLELAPFLLIAAAVAAVAYGVYSLYSANKQAAETTDSAVQATRDYNSVLAEQGIAMDNIATLSKQLRDASNDETIARLNGTQEEIEAAVAKRKGIEDQLSSQEKFLAALREEGTTRAVAAAKAVDQARASGKISEALQEEINHTKELREEQSNLEKVRGENQAKRLDDIRKSLGFSTKENFDLNVTLDEKTVAKLNGLKEVFESIKEGSADAKTQTQGLVGQIEELAGKVKTAGDFTVFAKDVDGYIEQLKSKGQTDLIPALEDLVRATLEKVSKTAGAVGFGGAAGLAQFTEDLNQAGQKAAESVKLATDKAREGILANQKQLDNAFSNGLIGVNDYYNTKIALEKEEAAQNALVSAQEIANLTKLQALSFAAGDSTKGENLGIQLQQKIDAQAAASRKVAQQEVDDNLKRQDSLRKLNEERQKASAELLGQLGDTFGQQQAELQITHDRTILELESQIRNARGADQLAAQGALDVENQLYRVKVQSIAAEKQLAELGLARAKVDQQETLAQAQFDNFQSSRQEYEETLNKLAQTRVDLAKQDLQITQDKIRTQPLSAALETEEAEKIKAVIDAQSKQLTQFRDVANSINSGFQSSVENFLDLVINQGKKVGDSLKQSLSTFLADVNKSIFKQVSGDLARSIGDIGGLVTGQATAGNDSGFGGFVNSIRSALGFKPGEDKKIDVPKPVGFDDESKALLKQGLDAKSAQATFKQGDAGHVIVDNQIGALNKPADSPKIAKSTEDQQKGIAPAPVQAVAATSGQLVVKDGDKDPGNDQLTKNEVTEIAAKQGLTPDQQSLLLAIYQRESSSGANPAALTPGVNGAVGGFQFIPSTFAETRKKAGLDEGDIDDPEDQAQTAAILIKNLSDKFNGDATKVAAAYLGGSGVVDSAGMIKVRFDGLGTSTVDYARQVVASADKIKANATVTDGDTTATTKGTTATTADTDALHAHTQALAAEADAILKKDQAGLDSLGTTTPGTDSVADLQAKAAAELPDDNSNARDQLLARGENTGGTPTNPIYVSAAQTPATTTGTPNPSNLIGTPNDALGGILKTAGGGLGGVLGAALGGKLGGTTGSGIGGILGTLLGSNVGTIAKGIGSLFGDSKKPSQSIASLQQAAGNELGDDPLKASGLLDQKTEVTSFFSDVKDTFSQGIDSLGDLVSGSGSALSSFFSSFGGAISDFFSSLSSEDSGGDSGSSGYGSLISSAVSYIGSFFADGGPVSGAGTGTSDSIPAMLSHGEYVMTAEKTAQYLPILEMMRSGNFDVRSLLGGMGNSRTFAPVSISPPRSGKFAEGGLVQSIAARGGQAGPSTPVVNINIDATGGKKTDATGNQDVNLEKFTQVMAGVARKTIQEEQRPGGSLNPATA